MDTRSGTLSYATNGFPDGALKTNFLHLGSGTEVAVPTDGAPGFYNAGPGRLLMFFLHSAVLVPIYDLASDLF